MFNAQRPVSHLRSPKKVARPYGQTKLPNFHPRKAFPATPPSPFDIHGARRAHMQNENAAPITVTPRRRKPRSEGTDYPSPEEFKKMHYLGPPPRKPNAPPRLVGDQIYIDMDDAAQPLVDELKSKGPLDEETQIVLQRLSALRFGAMVRANYHKEAVVVDEAIADAPQRLRNMEMRAAGVAKLRALREAKEQARQRELQAKREKEEARVRREQERMRKEQERLRQLREERERAAAQRELLERTSRRQAEEKRRRQMAAAQREAELARIRAAHRRHMEEVAAQKRQEEEMHRRWEALMQERERERQMKEEQERAARAAEEAARRAWEEQEAARRAWEEQAAARRAWEEQEAARRAWAEQERLAREEQERLAREQQERLAREEQERQARVSNEARKGECELYEAKWTELKTNQELKHQVCFHEFPFPVFTPNPLAPAHTDPAEITLERVREFVFHPFRRTIEGKTKREILKVEVLRWHPDKFNALICPKVSPTEWARTKEAAGLVARWVTTLMAED